MSSSAKPNQTARPDLNPDPDAVGGTTALNFVNTLRAAAGVPVETLHTDHDVRAWLQKMGLSEVKTAAPLPQEALLESARALRALTRTALEQKAAGKPVSVARLNRYLSAAVSHLRLHRTAEAVELRRHYQAGSAEQALAPLAEAIAKFLATADFTLVHRCEGAGCVLWFEDRPNGRRRRFCSEETCGVRSRVAAHRARKVKMGSS